MNLPDQIVALSMELYLSPLLKGVMDEVSHEMHCEQCPKAHLAGACPAAHALSLSLLSAKLQLN